MIQRIQSVYLLLGALAMGYVLTLDPVLNGPMVEGFGWYTPTMLGAGGVVVLVALVTIFLYKNRPQQRKVVAVAQAMTLLFVAVLFAGLYLADAVPMLQSQEGVDWGTVLLIGLPALAYLLFFLARRSIDKDIALVRSMDRLR